MTDQAGIMLNGADMRVYESSPNTGTTLAGSINVVSRYKKLRKKEDDMHKPPATRTIKPVPVSSKETAINKHDPHQPSEDKTTAKQIDVTAESLEDELYEPFIGVLVDYTA